MAKCKNRIDIKTDYSKPHTEWQAEEDAQIESWAARFRRENEGDLVGETVRFPAADSYAVYMVRKQKPLELVHVNVGDGWSIPEAHMRGLRITDIRKQVNSDRALAELFAKKAS